MPSVLEEKAPETVDSKARPEEFKCFDLLNAKYNLDRPESKILYQTAIEFIQAYLIEDDLHPAMISESFEATDTCKDEKLIAISKALNDIKMQTKLGEFLLEPQHKQFIRFFIVAKYLKREAQAKVEAPVVIAYQILLGTHPKDIHKYISQLAVLRDASRLADGILALEKRFETELLRTLDYRWLLEWQGQRLLLHLKAKSTESLMVLLNNYAGSLQQMTHCVGLINAGYEAANLLKLAPEWISEQLGFTMLMRIGASNVADLELTLLPKDNTSIQLKAFFSSKINALCESKLKSAMVTLALSEGFSNTEIVDRLFLLEKIFPGKVFAKLHVYLIEHIKHELPEAKGELRKLSGKQSTLINSALTVATPMLARAEFLISMLDCLKNFNSESFIVCFYQLYKDFKTQAIKWFIDNREQIVAHEEFSDVIQKSLMEEVEETFIVESMLKLKAFKEKFDKYKERFVEESKKYTGEAIFIAKKLEGVPMKSESEISLIADLDKAIKDKRDYSKILNLINNPSFLKEASEFKDIWDMILTLSADVGRVTQVRFSYSLPKCMQMLFSDTETKVEAHVVWQYTYGIEQLLEQVWQRSGLSLSDDMQWREDDRDYYVFDPRAAYALSKADLELGLDYLEKAFKDEFVLEQKAPKPSRKYFNMLGLFDNLPEEYVSASAGSPYPAWLAIIDQRLFEIEKNYPHIDVVFICVFKLPASKFVATFIHKNAESGWEIVVYDPELRAQAFMLEDNRCQQDKFNSFYQLQCQLQFIFPGANFSLASCGHTIRSRDYGFMVLDVLRQVLASAGEEKPLLFPPRYVFRNMVVDEPPCQVEVESGRVLFSYNQLARVRAESVRAGWYPIFERESPDHFRQQVRAYSRDYLHAKKEDRLKYIELVREKCTLEKAGTLSRLFSSDQEKIRSQIIEQWVGEITLISESEDTSVLDRASLISIGNIAGFVTSYSDTIPVDEHYKFILAAVYEDQLLQEFVNSLMQAESKTLVTFIIERRDPPSSVESYRVLLDYCYFSQAQLVEKVLSRILTLALPKVAQGFSDFLAEILNDFDLLTLESLLDEAFFVDRFKFEGLVDGFKLNESERSILAHEFKSNSRAKEAINTELMSGYKKTLKRHVETKKIYISKEAKIQELALREEFKPEEFRLALVDSASDALNKYFFKIADTALLSNYRVCLITIANLQKICKALIKVNQYAKEIGFNPNADLQNSVFLLLEEELHRQMARWYELDLTKLTRVDIERKATDTMRYIMNSLNKFWDDYTVGDIDSTKISLGLRYLYQEIFSMATVLHHGKEQQLCPLVNRELAKSFDGAVIEILKQPPQASLCKLSKGPALELVTIAKDFWGYGVPLTRKVLIELVAYCYRMVDDIQIEQEYINPLVAITQTLYEQKQVDHTAFDALLQKHYNNPCNDIAIVYVLFSIATSPNYSLNTISAAEVKFATVKAIIDFCSGVQPTLVCKERMSPGQKDYSDKLKCLKKTTLFFFSSFPPELFELSAMLKRWERVRYPATVGKVSLPLNRIEVDQLLQFIRHRFKTEKQARERYADFDGLSALDCLYVVLAYEVGKALNADPAWVLCPNDISIERAQKFVDVSYEQLRFDQGVEHKVPEMLMPGL